MVSEYKAKSGKAKHWKSNRRANLVETTRAIPFDGASRAGRASPNAKISIHCHCRGARAIHEIEHYHAGGQTRSAWPLRGDAQGTAIYVKIYCRGNSSRPPAKCLFDSKPRHQRVLPGRPPPMSHRFIGVTGYCRSRERESSLECAGAEISNHKVTSAKQPSPESCTDTVRAAPRTKALHWNLL